MKVNSPGLAGWSFNNFGFSAEGTFDSGQNTKSYILATSSLAGWIFNNSILSKGTFDSGQSMQSYILATPGVTGWTFNNSRFSAEETLDIVRACKAIFYLSPA